MSTLLDDYDTLLLDLDGTVYRGGTAVPGAPEAVAAALKRGTAIRYVTNNASRAAPDVAKHLRELGFEAAEEEVSTSAQAAAAILAEWLPAGSTVLVVGTVALRSEVIGAGMRVVSNAEDNPAAVVQGHSPDTGWRQLAEACLAIRGGALWVASNVDATLPTERGELPGNGSMVAALAAATGQLPVVAGKPEKGQLVQAAGAAGARWPLVVGDRLDTDIAGAAAAGMDSMLVLSGVTTAAGLLGAVPAQRPRYLAADIGGVHLAQARVEIASRPGWEAVLKTEDTMTLAGIEVGGRPDPLDALRTLCAVWWAAGGGALRGIQAQDLVAEEALGELGLR